TRHPIVRQAYARLRVREAGAWRTRGSDAGAGERPHGPRGPEGPLPSVGPAAGPGPRRPLALAPPVGLRTGGLRRPPLRGRPPGAGGPRLVLQRPPDGRLQRRRGRR